jgi:glycosyltransferase involved in cell wall biosynthesis
VAALQIVKAEVPELFVLLTGPARGYVRGALDRLGISYVHALASSRAEMAAAYHAADAYVVPARQEGGPKSVLESMAAGVPLVTTRVGQAAELVEEGANGWLVEVDDVEALASRTIEIHSGRAASTVERGRATAERFALERLDPLWGKLFEGFVARGNA